MTQKTTPSLSPPYITRLSLALSTLRDRASTFANCREVIASLARQARCDTISAFGHRYRRHHRIKIDTRNSFVVQFDPLQEKDAALRIDLNPFELGPSGLTAATQHLKSLLLDDFQPALASARAAEIAIAVDVQNIKVRDLFVFDRNKRKSCIHYGNDGEPYRIQLGADLSDLTFEIMDVDSEDKQSPPRTRITLTIIGKNVTSSELPKMNNPFAALQVWSIGNATGKGGLLWRLFQDACHRRGAAAALRMIKDDSKRERFRSKLTARYSFEWWQPDRIFAAVPLALEATNLFVSGDQSSNDPRHPAARKELAVLALDCWDEDENFWQ